MEIENLKGLKAKVKQVVRHYNMKRKRNEVNEREIQQGFKKYLIDLDSQ